MKHMEQELWSHLDACGLEFRLTIKELVQKYGSYKAELAGNLKNVSWCELGFQQPFIQGLTNPIIYEFSTNSDLSGFPRYILFTSCFRFLSLFRRGNQKDNAK